MFLLASRWFRKRRSTTGYMRRSLRGQRTRWWSVSLRPGRAVFICVICGSAPSLVVALPRAAKIWSAVACYRFSRPKLASASAGLAPRAASKLAAKRQQAAALQMNLRVHPRFSAGPGCKAGGRPNLWNLGIDRFLFGCGSAALCKLWIIPEPRNLWNARLAARRRAMPPLIAPVIGGLEVHLHGHFNQPRPSEAGDLPEGRGGVDVGRPECSSWRGS